MYLYYYSFLDDVYGVLEETDKTLLVELLRKKEKEHVKKEWLAEQIQDGKIDISKDKEDLKFYKKQPLSKFLKTSS